MKAGLRLLPSRLSPTSVAFDSFLHHLVKSHREICAWKMVGFPRRPEAPGPSSVSQHRCLADDQRLLLMTSLNQVGVPAPKGMALVTMLQILKNSEIRTLSILNIPSRDHFRQVGFKA